MKFTFAIIYVLVCMWLSFYGLTYFEKHEEWMWAYVPYIIACSTVIIVGTRIFINSFENKKKGE